MGKVLYLKVVNKHLKAPKKEKKRKAYRLVSNTCSECFCSYYHT